MEYVPREELERRWARLRRLMDCDALIVLQNVDQFYLTGTMQAGVLWFPGDGEPILAVRKSYERAVTESRVNNIVPIRSYSEIPSIVPKPGRTLGFEMDVVPVAFLSADDQALSWEPLRRCVDDAAMGALGQNTVRDRADSQSRPDAGPGVSRYPHAVAGGYC